MRNNYMYIGRICQLKIFKGMWYNSLKDGPDALYRIKLGVKR